MDLTDIEFLKLASNILPEFDGTPEELQRFIDAIELVDKFSEQHMIIAVAITKTKLKGTARNFVQNEDTLIAVRDRLKKCIKPETSVLIISKLKNLEQFNKTPNEYIKELEILTTALKRAYIVEGLSVDLAEEYTTDKTVEVIKMNSISDKVKLIMDAGNFKTVSEACTKFLFVTSEMKYDNFDFVQDISFNYTADQNTNNSNNSKVINTFSSSVNNSKNDSGKLRKMKKIPRYIRYMQSKAAEITLQNQ